MKKTVIVLLALFLALPAVSFAGSATSRWDMTIGGYVKFDMGWGSQAQGQDAYLAQRAGTSTDYYADKNGNFYGYAGETRLNFLTRGPDAWGAKTSAFVEGHFRGDSTSSSTTGTVNVAAAGAPADWRTTTNATNTSNQGGFALRHAFMQFDWPSTKLIIGQTWQKWGLLPTFANTLLEYNGLGPFLKGSRQPLVRVEQTFAKNWNWAASVISPTNTLGGNNQNGAGAVDTYTTSQYPFFEGSVGWTSDKCGNIGPWQMLFNLEGFYGKQKQSDPGWSANQGGVNINWLNSANFQTSNVDAWGIAFKGFIPVIPEKKGNKKGALGVSGVVFYAQNPGWYQGPVTAVSYNSQSSVTAATTWNSYHAPTTYGGWGQVSYYLTDKLYVNGWYGYMSNNYSQNFTNFANTGTNGWALSGQVSNTTQYILNVSYDVNAAIRFGLEGAYFNTRYLTYGQNPFNQSASGYNTQKDGSYYTVRVGAYYFF